MRLKTCCLAVLLAATALHSQSTLGTILGTVVDASGGTIPQAQLSLYSLDEGRTVSLRPGQLGLYEFLNLRPGKYTLSASAEGFGEGKTPPISLGARETRRVDFTLAVAPATHVGTVTAEVAALETESATIADSKNWEQLARLPLNTRVFTSSPFAAILAVPGVQQDSLGRVSIAGGLPLQIEYSVDGISTVNVASHLNADDLGPSLEMLQEFRVTSSGAGAAFGPMADVTVVSRGGTQQLHGSAFWYHQNRALDARIYGAPRKQQKVFNTFGASLGGPVLLPRIYNGANRTFFFADFESSRRPGTTLIQKLYPPASARLGDLSVVPGRSAVDPLNRLPFPGARIPASRINPVAARLLGRYYPLPNVTGANEPYNSLDLAGSGVSTSGYDLRGDHVVGPTQRIFIRWSRKTPETLSPLAAPLPASLFRDRYRGLAFGHSLALQRGLLNELRAGFSLAENRESFPIRGRDAVADLGLAGLDLRGAGDTGGFPYFDFSEGTSYPYTYHGRASIVQSRNYQISDTLSWVHGPHIAKFGFDIRRVGFRQTLHAGDGADDFGGFYFGGNSFSGNAFADLLLGTPAETYFAALGPDLNAFSTHASFFAMDQWRVSRRLSLEFGLRWELHPPFQEQSGNLTNFDHSNGNVIVPDSTLPAAPGFLATINACTAASAAPGCTKILTASQAGLPQTLRATDYSNWNPRLGFAFQPARKTVVRGAIGVYTQVTLGGLGYAMTGIHTSDVRTFENGRGPNGLPLLTLPNILPAPTTLGAVGREDFILGVDPRLRDPRSYQWNFTAQRELPWSMNLRLSYMGMQSIGIPERVDLNQLPASATPYSPARVPYKQWGYLGSVENIGFANYQGLHLEANGRLRKGGFFQATYVHSKNLGSLGTATRTNFPLEAIGPGVTDRFNSRYDRGNLSGARRDRLLLTGIFPLFPGPHRGWRMGLLAGWELNTLMLFQTGPFLTPVIDSRFDQSNTGLSIRASARPDRIGNGNLGDPTPARYFEKSAFAAVPIGAGRFGNSGAGILVGPGTATVAAGMARSLVFRENVRLRLEATFTNLFNHPNFAPPGTNISLQRFGQLTSAQSVENSGNRRGQLGLRLEF